MAATNRLATRSASGRSRSAHAIRASELAAMACRSSSFSKLFELRRLSGGKAAEVAGMSKVEFLDELARLGVPTVNLEEDQLEDEL
jgi:hypothetical protein